MSVTGITKRIVFFCDNLIGHITGGLAHVNVLGSMLFAGLTGSATADAAGLGTIEIAHDGRSGVRTRIFRGRYGRVGDPGPDHSAEV